MVKMIELEKAERAVRNYFIRCVQNGINQVDAVDTSCELQMVLLELPTIEAQPMQRLPGDGRMSMEDKVLGEQTFAATDGRKLYSGKTKRLVYRDCMAAMIKSSDPIMYWIDLCFSEADVALESWQLESLRVLANYMEGVDIL